jgi:hypothetical protein
MSFFQLFQRVQNQHQILRFDTRIAFLRQQKDLIILALLQTLKANSDETAEKTEKLFLEMCLRIKSPAWKNPVVNIVVPYCPNSKDSISKCLEALYFTLLSFVPVYPYLQNLLFLY